MSSDIVTKSMSLKRFFDTKTKYGIMKFRKCQRPLRKVAYPMFALLANLEMFERTYMFFFRQIFNFFEASCLKSS